MKLTIDSLINKDISGKKSWYENHGILFNDSCETHPLVSTLQHVRFPCYLLQVISNIPVTLMITVQTLRMLWIQILNFGKNLFSTFLSLDNSYKVFLSFLFIAYNESTCQS